MPFDQKKLVGKNWIKHWAGHWALLNDLYLGYQYTHGLKSRLGRGFEFAAFISRKGYTAAYLEAGDWQGFGQFLVGKVRRDPGIVARWCRELKNEADKILSLIKNLEKKARITGYDYAKFLAAFYDYGVPHRAVKVVVDFLPPKLLKQYLPALTKARVHAEPVYAETENFMRHTAEQVSKLTKVPPALILYVTKEEFDDYWQSGKLPRKRVLSKRYTASGIFYHRGKYRLYTGRSVRVLEKKLEQQVQGAKIIKGSSAYPGKVRGVVKIVFNPREDKNFKQGDILVTGMTRPEFLPLIKLSGAFVTDAGGMLSHAAITARELKKPCVVGTLVATKVLKTGFEVEVDAHAGEVRIIKS